MSRDHIYSACNLLTKYVTTKEIEYSIQRKCTKHSSCPGAIQSNNEAQFCRALIQYNNIHSIGTWSAIIPGYPVATGASAPSNTKPLPAHKPPWTQLAVFNFFLPLIPYLPPLPLVEATDPPHTIFLSKNTPRTTRLTIMMEFTLYTCSHAHVRALRFKTLQYTFKRKFHSP